MRTADQLHAYQKKAVNFQCSQPHSMMWLDMGLGKTVITLTSLAHLLAVKHLTSVIIVAPIRVCRLVWRQEAAKWAHTHHLRFSMVLGSRDQRTRALLRDADIYLTNYENLEWLASTIDTYFIKKGKPCPFDGIVWDEISKCKNSSTNRVKAVRKILPQFKWATGLTGTPASNGYKDLHGQYLVVDQGQRLGTSKTAFRTRFYQKVGPYKEVAYSDTEDVIKNLVGDITLEMSAEDYNPLPDLMVNDIECEMPAELRARYDQMERDFFLQLENGKSKEIFNAASLTNACLQFSNGAIYPIPGMSLWEPLHDLKLDALEELIDEANGQPILCAYAYRSDAERIMTKFSKLDPINLTECKSERALNDAMNRWKDGKCPLMIGHPACVHPDTLVLTQRRGWVRIIDVGTDDLVFDGIEFVSHSGCSFSGVRDVIDVFGITMTPDHLILIDGEWVEAKDVANNREAWRKAVVGIETQINGDRRMSSVRIASDDVPTECREAQSTEQDSLLSLHGGSISPTHRNSNLEDMEGAQTPVERPDRQELWRALNQNVSGMGKLRDLLFGYVGRIFRRSDHRTDRREWPVLERELHMDIDVRSAVEQAYQSSSRVSGREDSPCRTLPPKRVQQNNDGVTIEPRDDGGRSGRSCQSFGVREEHKTCEHPTPRKTAVFDLVDCGPRHRFVIRNDSGEMVICHNSMGHGVDGLQSRGHIVVWFGLTWSLDLYDQMNARLRRQGQGAPVICHRIMVRDTLDRAQAIALDDKAETQQGLRDAIKQYRLTRQ